MSYKPTHRIKHHILLTLLIAFTFANSLQNNFVGDDQFLILENHKIHNISLGEMPSLLTTPMWKMAGIETRDDYYRPVLFLLFAFNYKIWGANPLGFHLINMLLHIAAVILLYHIGLILFKGDERVALIAAAIFAVHPSANNEPIGRVANGEVVFGFLTILSLYFFLQDKKIHSLLTFLLALSAKELAVMLPLMLILPATYGKGWRKGFFTIMPYLAIVGIYFIIRTMLVGSMIGHELHQPIAVRIFTMASATLDYIRLLLIPYPLRPFYPAEWHISLLEPKVFIAVIALSLICLLAFKIRKDKVMLFLLISPLILLSPVIWRLNTFPVTADGVTEGTYIAERWLYVPAMFVSLFLANLAARLGKNRAAMVSIPIIIVFAVITISFNTIWKDPIALATKIARDKPESVFAHSNLGSVYYGKGLMDKALEHYLIAIKLQPNLPEVHNKLGVIYYNNGLLDKAMEYFQIAIRLKPDYSEAYYNMSIAYEDKGMINMALEYYQIAIRLKPNYQEAHHNMGAIYAKQGLLDTAMDEFKIASKLNPADPEAHYNMGNIYYKQGRIDDAAKEFQITIKLKPDHAGAHTKLKTIVNGRDYIPQP